MGVNLFNAEQIEQLKINPYVKKASDKAITYSEEFKEEFIKRLQARDNPSKILTELGFNTKVLGKRRVSEIARRCKKYALRSDGTKDTRKFNSRRPITKDLTTEEKISKLEHKNRILEQENEFLKKMIFLAKKIQWGKSQQKKNIK